jgi:peptidyl-prolyl cis-trans isomerase SurA
MGWTTVNAQDERVIDEIVAVVGNDILLASDVDGYVISTMNQQQVPYSDELWREALQQLVNDKVLVIHAKRDTNLVVSDQQVEQMLDQRIGQMSVRVGGEAVLEQMYGKTVLEIKADFREEFRNQLLADQFRGQKLRSIKATPSDVRAWFRPTRCRHFLTSSRCRTSSDCPASPTRPERRPWRSFPPSGIPWLPDD